MGEFMTETQHRPAGVPHATEPPEGRGTLVTGRADTPEAAVILERTRASVDPEMRAAVESLPPSMRRIAGYHFGWTDPDGTPATGGAGKAIRPALVLTAAAALGGPRPSERPSRWNWSTTSRCCTTT